MISFDNGEIEVWRVINARPLTQDYLNLGEKGIALTITSHGISDPDCDTVIRIGWYNR